MANRSYLFVSDYDGICPAWGVGVEDIEQKVLAEDVYCVPLLWLALFRPADLRTAYFPSDDDDDDVDEFAVTAPLASKEQALAQLEAALPVLHRLFAAEGPLDEYVALMREGISAMSGSFVTVDLYEIAVLEDDTEYYRTLRAGLASFDEPGEPSEDRQRLIDLAQLRAGRPFPPSRLVLDQLDAPDDDVWNHTRLLGVSYLRPVPWEKSPISES